MRVWEAPGQQLEKCAYMHLQMMKNKRTASNGSTKEINELAESYFEFCNRQYNNRPGTAKDMTK